MDLDDILRATDLPEVSVNTDQALAGTFRRRNNQRRRRRGIVGLATLLTAVGLIAATGTLTRRDHPQRVAAGDSATPKTPPGEAAVWDVDPASPPSPAATSITTRVNRLGCNNGVTGTVRRPQITFADTRVTITFTVEPTSGDGTCLGNNAVPYKVDLGRQLGGRALVDGSCRTGRPAATTSFCRNDGGIRWIPPTITSAIDPRAVGGVMELVGGPAGTKPIRVPGTVSAINEHGHLIAEVKTNSNGRFAMNLPPGTYQFTGSSPKYGNGRGECRSDRKVSIIRRPPSEIIVACEMR